MHVFYNFKQVKYYTYLVFKWGLYLKLDIDLNFSMNYLPSIKKNSYYPLKILFDCKKIMFN